MLLLIAAKLTSMNHRTHDLITLPLLVAFVVSFTLCVAAPSSDTSFTSNSTQDPLSTQSQSGENVSSQVETVKLSPAALARLDDHLTRVYPWSREEYPNPLISPRYCRNMFSSNICDPDDILDEREKSELDQTIRQMTELKCYCDKCTTNTKGIGVGVALMKAIYKEYMVHPFNNTQNFAESLRQKWKLGLCDNDVVILVSVKDRQWYPAIGGRLSRIISEQALEGIKEQTKKSFANEQVFQGLQTFLQGTQAALREREKISSGEHHSLTFDGPDDGGSLGFFLGILFVAFLLLVLICLALYTYLVRRKEKARENAADPIDKKEPIEFVSDGEDEGDVVVYDRVSTTGDDKKTLSSAWSDIRGKLTSHRKQPATDAEKAVLNEPNERDIDKAIENEKATTVTQVRKIAPYSDDEIEHVDIENINTAPMNSVYRETTVSIDTSPSSDE